MHPASLDARLCEEFALQLKLHLSSWLSCIQRKRILKKHIYKCFLILLQHRPSTKGWDLCRNLQKRLSLLPPALDGGRNVQNVTDCQKKTWGTIFNAFLLCFVKHIFTCSSPIVLGCKVKAWHFYCLLYHALMSPLLRQGWNFILPPRL